MAFWPPYKAGRARKAAVNREEVDEMKWPIYFARVIQEVGKLFLI